MEENILKFFTGTLDGSPTTLEPENITNGVFDVNSLSYRYLMTTNDKQYCIRYGGFVTSQSYNAIEVYDMETLENGNPLYRFDDLTINNHTFTIRDLKQDKDDRFYGIAEYYDGTNTLYYLILFNNFVQDGICVIRKYYSNATMGIPNDTYINYITKKEDSADYYMFETANNKIYHYKIDITAGNSLEIYNCTQGGTITSGSFTCEIDLIGNNLIIMENWENDNSTACECKKLIIDITKEISGTYTFKSVYYRSLNSNRLLIAHTIYNHNFYIGYLDQTSFSQTQYNFSFRKIDLNGNTISITDTNNTYTSDISVSFADNYCFLYGNSNLYAYIYNPNTNTKSRFLNISFEGVFGQPQIIQKFNLIYFIGLNGRTSMAYCKNISTTTEIGETHYWYDFATPRYLNLYSGTENTSVIFSRNALNRFLSENQLTCVFNIPNYLMNDVEIQKESIYSDTEYRLQRDYNVFSKNRFESLYMSYIYSIYVTDNTNQNNLSNMIGANRVAKALWNNGYEEEEEVKSPCLKARISRPNGNIVVIPLVMTNVSGSSHTFNYSISGDVTKIEYLSYDLKTIYATYRCSLSGTHTISQTIRVRGG